MNRKLNFNREIVREYMTGIEDNQLSLMCYLWSSGASDDTVRRRLRLSWPQLRALKAKIAGELLDAGVELAD